MKDKVISINDIRSSSDTFEANLKELEEIVNALENNKELPLSVTLEKFQRGAALLNECRSSLGTIESFVNQVTITKDNN